MLGSYSANSDRSLARCSYVRERIFLSKVRYCLRNALKIKRRLDRSLREKRVYQGLDSCLGDQLGRSLGEVGGGAEKEFLPSTGSTSSLFRCTSSQTDSVGLYLTKTRSRNICRQLIIIPIIYHDFSSFYIILRRIFTKPSRAPYVGITSGKIARDTLERKRNYGC
jgi:hypothetical protein